MDTVDKQVRTEPRPAKSWNAFGESKTLRSWAEDPRCLHHDLGLLHQRVRKGMPLERAMQEPKAIWGGPRARKAHVPDPDRKKKKYSSISTAGLTNRTVTAHGETKTVPEWLADSRCELGTCATLIRRLEFGMTPEQALRKLPRLPIGKVYEAFGERKGLDDWARDPRCKTSRGSLFERVGKGIPFIEALTQPAGKVARQGRGAPRKFTAFGESKTLREWADDPRSEVGHERLEDKVRLGIPLEEAMKRSRRRSSPNSTILEAFGEAKSIAEWSRDPRCRIGYGALCLRIRSGEPLEMAIARVPDLPIGEKSGHRQRLSGFRYRNPSRPYRGMNITAFGETKSPEEWAKDQRCTVRAPSLVIRIKNGLSPEAAITSANRTGVYEAFGDRKTLAEWEQDPRCTLTAGGLRVRLQRGMNLEEALTKPRLVDIQRTIHEQPFEAFGEP